MRRLLPAYPLFTKDPFFSVWSTTEILTDSDTVFWHGEDKPIYGRLEIDGEEFGFMGVQSLPPMTQTSLEVDSFSTRYTFECEKAVLKLEFVSPLLPNDLEVLSCPVCYLRYELIPKTAIGSAAVTISLEERIAYNTCDETDKKRKVRAGVIRRKGYMAGYIGRFRQMILSHSSDETGSDWGYYYLSGDTVHVDRTGARTFLTARNQCLSKTFGTFMLAYDDLCSVNYFGELLRGYFFSEKRTIMDALDFSRKEETRIIDDCAAFDRRVSADAQKYGEEYKLLLDASLRQCIAAHKLVRDSAGRALFLSKECNSDGCVATVDITYPSAPMFLLYNPDLLKGMLYPILDFARMDVWKYDFAPHDAGIYPYVFGQFYAVSNGTDANNDLGITSFSARENIPQYYLYSAEDEIYDENRQMPVEECGNMLILCAAVVKAGNDNSFALKNMDLFRKWVRYLVQFGKVPANQLCTDDFAGHLEKNCNLSIKAAVGIAAYSYLCKVCGDTDTAQKMMRTAKEFAAYFCENALLKNGSRLSYDDSGDTFSLKYNLAFDKLFGFNLFDASVYEHEVDSCLTRMNEYGIPLDSRKSYTKSDWQMWVATLTEDADKSRLFIEKIVKYLRETPSRVPFSDWYDTVSGEYNMFRNRTVHGANFIPILRDKNILCKDEVNYNEQEKNDDGEYPRYRISV